MSLPDHQATPTRGTPRVRAAAPGDLDAVAAVFLRCWQIAYADLLPAADRDRWTVQRARATWAAHLGDPGVEVAVADDGAVRGVARFRAGHLDSLYVDPAAAGQGIGRLLLEVVVDRTAAAGAGALELWVFEANQPAQRFYRRLGFELDGRRRSEPGYGSAEIGMTRRVTAPR